MLSVMKNVLILCDDLLAEAMTAAERERITLN